VHNPSYFYFFTTLVPDCAPIKHLAESANTHRWWPVPVVPSTRAPSLMLSEHIHGLKSTSSPLNRICPRQQRSKIVGVPVPVYPTRSHSIQGLGMNQWPTRTTMLVQLGQRQLETVGRHEQCPQRRSRATTWRSLSYGVTTFNWPRPGASLAVRNASHGVMPHDVDDNRFGGNPEFWGYGGWIKVRSGALST
jgi:hypothetical protein